MGFQKKETGTALFPTLLLDTFPNKEQEGQLNMGLLNKLACFSLLSFWLTILVGFWTKLCRKLGLLLFGSIFLLLAVGCFPEKGTKSNETYPWLYSRPTIYDKGDKEEFALSCVWWISEFWKYLEILKLVKISSETFTKMSSSFTSWYLTSFWSEVCVEVEL